ncbi:MAG: hydroxyacylglutathione hydrolase [Pseudomonadota bacterium]
MPIEIITIPCLADNYAFLVHDDTTGETALVDAPEAAPILSALTEKGWTLSEIWITHHHFDHVQGVAEILAAYPAKVRGAAADQHRLPPLDIALEEGEEFTFAGQPVRVLDVSGHTLGHIAFYMPDSDAVFTADSLMALGCGRLTEGTAEQMWESLSKIAALPPNTTVFSGHEYTGNNARFALTIEPDNEELILRSRSVEQARAQNQPTVPSLLSLELATNPFLRASNASVRENLDMQGASDVEVFAEVRSRKDAF